MFIKAKALNTKSFSSKTIQLTYAIIGIFRLWVTMASTWQLPSGPKIVATPSQIISVMARVEMTVSPRVSFQRSTRVTFGKIFGSLLISSEIAIGHKLIRTMNRFWRQRVSDVLPKAIVIAPDMARPWRSLRSPLIAVRYPTLSSVFLWLPSTDAGELMKRMSATRTREKACNVDMAPELFYGADHDRAAKMCQKTAAKKTRKEETVVKQAREVANVLYLDRWHHQFPDVEHASLYSIIILIATKSASISEAKTLSEAHISDSFPSNPKTFQTFFFPSFSWFYFHSR